MNKPLDIAILFHETYERLAPDFGYETRQDTKKFDPESKNGKLMVAVCGTVCAGYEAKQADAHRLASLVLANADALSIVLPDARNEILLLARSIAPDALITPPQMRENSSPHDPGAYTLVGSPAQTGEAGSGRFEPCE